MSSSGTLLFCFLDRVPHCIFRILIVFTQHTPSTLPRSALHFSILMFCLSVTFLTAPPPVQLVLLSYAWVWGYPQEHDKPIVDHDLTENGLFLPSTYQLSVVPHLSDIKFFSPPSGRFTGLISCMQVLLRQP